MKYAKILFILYHAISITQETEFTMYKVIRQIEEPVPRVQETVFARDGELDNFLRNERIAQEAARREEAAIVVREARRPGGIVEENDGSNTEYDRPIDPFDDAPTFFIVASGRVYSIPVDIRTLMHDYPDSYDKLLSFTNFVAGVRDQEDKIMSRRAVVFTQRK